MTRVSPAQLQHSDTAENRATPKGERVGVWQRWHLGALLAHVALSVIFTWPLVLNFLPDAGTTVPGVMIEDRDQNLWNLWWVRQAVLQGRNPFVTDMIWYPTPVTLYYHTLNVFNGLLAIPLLSIFSLTTTYNIIILLSFLMGGYGAFLLAHYICGNRWAALVGSLVFAYSAYHIATMRNLLQLVSLEWVPFFVLFLLQAVFRPSWLGRADVLAWLWRRALPAGVALFLVTLVDWYYTLFSLMIAGLVALYLLMRNAVDLTLDRRSKARMIGEGWLRIGVCLAIYLLLASPILVPTLRELGSADYVLAAPNAAVSNSADLLAFFQPPRDQRLWGRLFTNRNVWPFAGNRYEVYFTYTALFLAGVALFATRSTRPRLDGDAPIAGVVQPPGKWFWAASALLFFALALGPVLQVNGVQIRWLFLPDFKLVMPYGLLEGLPIFNVSRSPDRFDMPLTLCLGILAGFGVNVLLKAWRTRLPLSRRAPLLALGAVALITLELFPMPYVQRRADIPPWYFQLGKEPGDFAILEMPPQDDYWHGAYRMYYQTAHGKRIYGGYLSREYPHPFLESTTGFQELVNLDGEGDMFATQRAQWISALAHYKTRYIVLQKDRLPERDDPPVDVSPSRDAIRRVLGPEAQPVYDDEWSEVYGVPQPTARVPFLSVGTGWEPREVGPNGTFRWMGGSATLRIDAPRSEQAYLSFRGTGVGEPRRLLIYHGDQLIFDEMVGALQTYRTKGPLGLPEGASTLTFVSPRGTSSPAQLGLGDDARQLSFAIMQVRLDPPPGNE